MADRRRSARRKMVRIGSLLAILKWLVVRYEIQDIRPTDIFVLSTWIPKTALKPSPRYAPAIEQVSNVPALHADRAFLRRRVIIGVHIAKERSVTV